MESRKLSKISNDYFSDEEIAETKERFPESDRIHKLIARLEAAEKILLSPTPLCVNCRKSFEPLNYFELVNKWRKAAGK